LTKKKERTFTPILLAVVVLALLAAAVVWVSWAVPAHGLPAHATRPGTEDRHFYFFKCMLVAKLVVIHVLVYAP
jgi:hypothetical protein